MPGCTRQNRHRIVTSAPEAAAVVNEMQEMRVKVTPFGQGRFAAWRRCLAIGV